MPLAPFAFFALLTACVPGGVFQGTLTDGLTGQPLAETRILLKSKDTTDMTCGAREATTDAAGAFKIENTCAGATYEATTPDPTLFLATEGPLVGGDATGVPVALKAWRSPEGAGIQVLAGTELKLLRTFSDVAQETLLGTTEIVKYPASKPTGKVATIPAGEYLVLSGKDNVDRLKFYPLVDAPGPRKFEGAVTIPDHAFIGVSFTSDTVWERIEATPNPAKVIEVQTPEHVIKYVAGDALPAGRYAMLGEKDKRVFIVDFGASQAPGAGAPAEGAPAEGAPAEGG